MNVGALSSTPWMIIIRNWNNAQALNKYGKIQMCSNGFVHCFCKIYTRYILSALWMSDLHLHFSVNNCAYHLYTICVSVWPLLSLIVKMICMCVTFYVKSIWLIPYEPRTQWRSPMQIGSLARGIDTVCHLVVSPGFNREQTSWEWKVKSYMCHLEIRSWKWND